ncbi:MAG TPA: FecR domain-containing protein [Puia sp.]|jgi:transmembrane sensor|nr:FecR domain-containing protein [Puia sp.]
MIDSTVDVNPFDSSGHNDPPIYILVIRYIPREMLTEEDWQSYYNWCLLSSENRQIMDCSGSRRWLIYQWVELNGLSDAELWEEINQWIKAAKAQAGVWEAVADTRPKVERASPRQQEVDPKDGDAEEPVKETAVGARPMRKWLRPVIVGLAAVLFLAVFKLGLSSVTIFSRGERPVVDSGAVAHVFVPAESEVVFVGSDGRKVNLDSTAVGSIVTEEGNCVIVKSDSNSLTYQQSQLNIGDTAARWNSLAIGRSRGPWHLQLPDGSSVLLDGGSCFCYPLDRKRAGHGSLFEGRALFEIARNASEPFVIRVANGGQEAPMIQVLGTAFQLETGRAASTTRVLLFNGALRVLNGIDSILLKDSMQEAVLQTGGMRVRPIGDSTRAVGWAKKIAFFDFKAKPLAEVIRQVADWYGYRVVQTGNGRWKSITTNVFRSPSLDVVLRQVQEAESGAVYLRREGDTIVMSSNSSGK